MSAPDRPSAGRRTLGWILRVVAYGTLFAIGAWVGLVVAAFPTLDDLEARAEVRHVPGAILAADGTTVLRRLRAPTTRTYLDVEDVPDVLADAVVAAEDRRFYEHSGIDVRGIARAAHADLQSRSTSQGGSTITQQLVKNTYVGTDRTIARKSREAILAVALETRWSKERILTAYLNSAYFGSGRYGAADAARGYFGTSVAKLTPPQAALLAGLLRAPEANDPDHDRVRARAARARVLEAMGDLDMLTPAQVRAGLAAPLPAPRRSTRRARSELAPHLSDVVVGDLIEHYGVARALGGGLRARTTIDAATQRAASDAIAPVAARGLDVAIVAIDPHTGEVRAAAQAGPGASGAFNIPFDGQRQPGSAFKPFMLTAAYEAGYAPGTVIPSAPFDEAYPGGRFRVTNGGGYAGNTTLERATWQSDNTVYARLQDRLGIDSAITAARAAGIRSRMDPVPALVLGALPQGTTPLELAHAYATFADHGVRTSMVGGGPRYLDSVTEPGSGTRWRPRSIRRQALPRGVADQVTATLQGVIRSGTGTGAAIGRPAAGKTGTTEEYRDAWFVGYTPDLVAAVWVGHARGGVPMTTENGGGPVTGGSLPASTWRSFMSDALDGSPVHDFELRRPTYVTVHIDPDTGLLAGPWCAGSVSARFLAGKEPTTTSRACVERDRPIPDLVGLSADDARDVLDEQSFEVAPTIEERLVTRPELSGVVVEQRPAAGTRVFRDEQVVLVVGHHPFDD